MAGPPYPGDWSPPEIQSWDQAGGSWDSGLQWDVNLGPNLGDVEPYLDLITSEHRSRRNYIATVIVTLQPLADGGAVAQTMIGGAFDLDLAAGQQLDFVGQWVGATRYVDIPYSVYFSWDVAGLGWDQAIWWEPFNPTTSLVRLPDDAYRTLLRAKIAANQWDGTIPGAYEVWDTLFAGTGMTVLLQDNDDMTMTYALLGSATPDAVTIALFEGGYLDLKPAGVAVDYYVTQTLPNAPFFGFDVENSSIAGFDVGQWGKLTPGQ